MEERPWELHVDYSLSQDKKLDDKIKKLAGTKLVKSDYYLDGYKLVFEFPSKQLVTEARRRIKAKLREKVDCEIVPTTK
jgi:hypothetical protein